MKKVSIRKLLKLILICYFSCNFQNYLFKGYHYYCSGPSTWSAGGYPASTGGCCCSSRPIAFWTSTFWVGIPSIDPLTLLSYSYWLFCTGTVSADPSRLASAYGGYYSTNSWDASLPSGSYCWSSSPGPGCICSSPPGASIGFSYCMFSSISYCFVTNFYKKGKILKLRYQVTYWIQ